MSALGLFASADQINYAAQLEGESYIALFGSVAIDFTRQQLTPGDHTVSATALFGSVKLVFPADVEVRLEATPIFGSAELKDLRARAGGMATSSVRVTVQGVALFGRIEVQRTPELGDQAHAAYELSDSEQFDRSLDEPRAYEGVTRKISPHE